MVIDFNTQEEQGKAHEQVQYIKSSSPSNSPTVVVGDDNSSVSFNDPNIQDNFLYSFSYDSETDTTDNMVDRQDMISIFVSAEDDGSIDQGEITDIQNIINHADFEVTADYSWNRWENINVLSQKVLNSVEDGSSADQLQYSINKFFYGSDHPQLLANTNTDEVSYTDESDTPLFADGVQYSDVAQGAIGDCYLLASMAATAYRDSSAIEDMFIGNGDGTYSVRYYVNGQADYVTVDSALPTDSNGNQPYANASNELWVALGEKAYAQLNEEGNLGQENAANSYDEITGGWPNDALTQITGNSFTWDSFSSESFDVNNIIDSWNNGEAIVFATPESPQDTNIVGSHAYGVIGYDSESNQFQLYNPWGPGNDVFVSASNVQASFDGWSHGFV